MIFSYLQNMYQLFDLYLVLISLVIYLVITDDRFTRNRKVIFIIGFFLFLILSVYIEKTPYLIIKDLFWYSVVLNGSFIFHVIILDRIFYWCWKNNYEYIGHLISRFSFTFSISGIIAIILSIFFYLLEFELKNKKRIFPKIQKLFFYYPAFIIILISLHFSTIFHNYSLLLMGNYEIKYTKAVIIKHLIIFIIFFIIAYIIGLPRLYVIWIFQFILESYKILNQDYINGGEGNPFDERDFYHKIKDHFFLRNEELPILLLQEYFGYKYSGLANVYEKPYHELFMFDLVKFLNRYSNEYYAWKFLDKKYISPIIKNQLENITPIKSIYKFYPWKDLAIGYSTEGYLYTKKVHGYHLFDDDSKVKIAWDWCKKVNQNHYPYDLFKEILIILEYGSESPEEAHLHFSKENIDALGKCFEFGYIDVVHGDFDNYLKNKKKGKI